MVSWEQHTGKGEYRGWHRVQDKGPPGVFRAGGSKEGQQRDPVGEPCRDRTEVGDGSKPRADTPEGTLRLEG